MSSVIVPKPEYITIAGKSNMVFSSYHAESIYSCLSDLAQEAKRFAQVVLGEDDESPSNSSKSYVEYLIARLKISQALLPVGIYLTMHIGQIYIDSFLSRIKKETRWRLADGSPTPQDSWLTKGQVYNLPNAKGVFLRGWSNSSHTDPEGWNRAIGSFQDFSLQEHIHAGSFIDQVSTGTSGGSWYWGEIKFLNGSHSQPNTGGVVNNNVKVSFSETRPCNISVLYLILT